VYAGLASRLLLNLPPVALLPRPRFYLQSDS
jgi:hypothetical protein